MSEAVSVEVEVEEVLCDDLAQKMFAAYNVEAGGKTWDGKDIPPWEKTGPKVQANWRAAARCALHYFTDNVAVVEGGCATLPVPQ